MARAVKVLVGYDGSECADAMLDDLPRSGLPREGEVFVVSVGDVVELAQRAAARIQVDFPTWVVRAESQSGSPAKVLMEVADSWKPDLLIVGSHGRSGIGRLLLGSVSRTLVVEAPCSVRVARRRVRPGDAPLRLLIGTDGSANANAALDEVAARHWPPASEVRVVHAIARYPDAEAKDIEHHEHAAMQAAALAAWQARRGTEITEAAAERLRHAGLATSTLVRTDSAKRMLLDEAKTWEADCVFVGATGLGVFDRLLLGSTSTAVVLNASCSVEVVRPQPPR